MNEKIIEGLKKLDPNVDAHWNQDGQVNLNAFKFIMNGEAVTREQIEEAAPGFRRDNTSIGGESTSTTDEATPAAPANAAVSDGAMVPPSDVDTSKLSKVETVEGTYDPDADPGLLEHNNGSLNVADGPKTALGGDSSFGQPGTGTLENQMDGSKEKKLNELTIQLQVSLEDSLKSLLGMVADKQTVSALSDEELAQLRSQVPELRAKAFEVKDAISKIVDTHTAYLDDVIRAADARVPSETLQQKLAAYHATLNNAESLPINQPRARQVQSSFKTK